MVPFKKLLHQGTIAELAVMDEINKGRAFAQVYQDVPYDYMNATWEDTTHMTYIYSVPI